MAIDAEYDKYVVIVMLQNYGDVLKVSRTRGITQTLPKLRKHIASSETILEEYEEQIKSEQEGQGLKTNALLSSLIEAQLAALSEGSHQNGTTYAEEIKNIIKKGSATREAGEAVATKSDEVVDDGMFARILADPTKINPEDVTTAVATKIREYLLESFEHFAKWSFHIQMGFPFQSQDFHDVIFKFGQDLVDGVIDRGIVTIPPRHSKTQTLSISLPLYSFCHNPRSHNIITSYADDVVQESSGYIRQTMGDPLFQKIFPSVRIDPNKRSLERWGTTKMGVMHAVPTGGKMTGKGAGSLSNLYSGVFVVDDAIKPKDAYSNTVRTEINDRYDNTFMSRLANDGIIQNADGVDEECSRTPIVIIMQRVHDDDLVGYLLRGSSSDKYHWLNIPALVEKGVTGSQEFYDHIIEKQGYTNAIPYLYKLPRKEPLSALWPSRKSLASLLSMQATTPYTFNSQYLGDPTAKGAGLVQEEWWHEYEELDKSKIVRTFMTADTASTKETYSDFSAVFYWGVTREKQLVMIDCMIGKYEVPELIIEVKKFWTKHNTFDYLYPLMLPEALYMEDKSSGQYMNQIFIREGSITCRPVPRDKSGKDKIARFINTLNYWAQGRVLVPSTHKHKSHVMREVLGYTGRGSGTANDDVIDNFSDACDIAFAALSCNYEAWM